MQITAKEGAAINTERQTKAIIGLAWAACDFTNAMREMTSAAAVGAMNCFDWKALGAALAAAGYGAPKEEPDKNPVRFIGIRKGGWKHGRRKYRC